MSGTIPKDFIQDLLTRVDLVDLIDARVPLKRSGNNFVARCPFHSEKTASFNVSREKQFYHCFGCGAHGNAIDFLREYDRLGFVEAVESLADSVGLRIPARQVAGGQDRQQDLASRLFEAQEHAARFFQEQLRFHPAADRAIAYLKERGVTDDSIQKYRLGYAPAGWQNLSKVLPPPVLEAAGLVVSRDGKRYDRFRDRIMFPIRDRRGRIAGFGGRVLGEETPKYLNSPETPVFKKHREVYGLYELLNTREKPASILVVEGYLDVIAMAQYGLSNAVAALGTAMSGEHFDVLFRYANDLVLCFDGDQAGRNAAWKALETGLPALREGRSLRFLTLPQGHDPDSLVRREGRDGFLARLAEAQPFSKYLIEQITTRLGFATIATSEQRAALVYHARPLIEKLPTGSFREAVSQEMVNRAGPAWVERQDRSVSPREIGGEVSVPDRGVPSLLRKFMCLLVRNPRLAATIPPEIRKRLETGTKAGELLGKVLAVLDERPNLTLGGLLEHFRGTPEEGRLVKLAEENARLTSIDETATCIQAARMIDENVDGVFQDILHKLDEQIATERLEALIHKSREAGLSPEETEELRRLTTREFV